MSYDLFFHSCNMQSPVDNETVLEWFSHRQNFRVSNCQADYENSETDVHFLWDVFSPADAEPDDPNAPAFASLSINYCRPTYFAKEAAIELFAFIKKFEAKVYDPQEGKFWEPPFSEEMLVKKYAQNAVSGVRAMLSFREPLDKIYSLDTEKLDAIWEWNYNRASLTASLDEDLFVPKISTFIYNGDIVTAVVWADGVPMLAPKVDIALVFRRETGPKTGFFRKRVELIEIVPFDAFMRDFQTWFKPSSISPDTVSSSPSSSDAIKAVLCKRPAGVHTLMNVKSDLQIIQQIALSAIVDEELFAD